MELKSEFRGLYVSIIIFITLSVILVGCKKGLSYDKDGNVIKDKYYYRDEYGITDKEVNESFTGDMVTKEYLNEVWGITDEDLKDIDLDDVVYYKDLFVKRMDENNSREQILDKLRRYQEQLDHEKFLKENDKSYLLEAELTEEPLPDIKSVKYLLFEIDTSRTFMSSTKSRLIDFENNKYYESRQSLKTDYIEMDDYIEFSDEEEEIIIKELDNLGIFDWYGKNKERDDWKMGIEFEDGTVITMSGNTDDEKKPKNFDEFIQFLQVIEKDEVLEWFDYYY